MAEEKPIAPGDNFLGSYCAKCGTAIAVMRDPGNLQLTGEGVIVVVCPSCTHENTFPATSLERLTVVRQH